MKKFLTLGFVITISFLLISYSYVKAQNKTLPSHVPDEIIVKLKKPATPSHLNQLAEKINSDVERELLIDRTFILKVPKDAVEDTVNELSKLPEVESASPNFIAYKLATTNDPSLDKEWGLYKIQAANQAGISAWDTTQGDTDVTVAVLDTGIYKNHPDLEGKVITEKNFSASPTLNDIDGHGTHIAGSIAAVTNNGVGIAGLGYKTTLMNVKVLSDDGSGSYADIADGIKWAADNGADVINLSLGGSATISVLEDAVKYAYDKGVVIVAASGNNGSSAPIYPAYYPQVLSVAATDESDKMAVWSNHGTWVKVASPGVSNYSTYKNDSYAQGSGTSMATSYVSGLAALVWSSGRCTTNDCVVDRIQRTSDNIDGTGSKWQYGRINAFRAVSDVLTDVETPTATPTLTPVLTNIPSVNPIPTSVQQPTGTPTPTRTPTPTTAVVTLPNSMTVSTLEMFYVKRGSRYDVYINAKIVRESDGIGLSNALITLDVTTPSKITYTGATFTDGKGTATFVLRSSREKGIYKSIITDAYRNGYTYTPSITSATLTVN